MEENAENAMKKNLFKKLLLVLVSVGTIASLACSSTAAASTAYFNVYKTGAGTGDRPTQTIYVDGTGAKYTAECSSALNAKVRIGYPGGSTLLVSGEVKSGISVSYTGSNMPINIELKPDQFASICSANGNFKKQ